MSDRIADAWPKCAVAPCQNKCCLRLRSKYCWPHTPGVRPDEVKQSLLAELNAGPEHETAVRALAEEWATPSRADRGDNERE